MRANRIICVLRALLLGGVGMPGMTRGEIRRAAMLPPDTEITRPLRDLRKAPYSLDVRCDEYTDDSGEQVRERIWRYWLPTDEAEKARSIIRNHDLSTAPKGSAEATSLPKSLESGALPSAPDSFWSGT